MKELKLVSMSTYILDIDYLGTKEFCEKYNIPLPFYTGDVRTSADQFIKLDLIKYKMFVDYAKLLQTEITADILVKKMNFEKRNEFSRFPIFKKDEFYITKCTDGHGFYIKKYDFRYFRMISKIEDIVNLGLSYNLESNHNL